MKCFHFLLLIGLFGLLGCESGPELPREAPADFQLEWFEGGALSAESELIRISADSLFQETWLNQKRTVRRVPQSEGSFGEFYAELRDLKPLALFRKGPPDVYSNGGQAIWIRWKNTEYQLVNAADFLTDEEKTRFAALEKMLKARVSERLSGMSKSYRIGLTDTSPLDPIQQVHVFVERETALYRRNGETDVPPRMDTTLQLVPGPYVVQVSGERKSGSFWAQETLSFSDKMNGLEIEVYGVNVEFKKTTE